jgi:adenosylcobinamide-GDP ribazoletransferase
VGALKSIVLAFACFSRIPMPKQDWDEGSMRYLMAAFPLVGVVVGACVFLWCLASDALGLGVLLRAAGIALIPVAVSGGIHLDGFADVVDAQASHADASRKREILKDPHIGAFAAMAVASYLVLYVGLAGEIPAGWRAAALLACVHVAVRCESAAATVLIAGVETGMLASFRAAADTRRVLAVVGLEYALVVAGMLALAPLPAAFALVGGACCFFTLRPFARRCFGGMSGDVAGFFLQACELVMLLCLVVGSKVVAL